MRLLSVLLFFASFDSMAAPLLPLSPSAEAFSTDGTLYLACATANEVLRFDTASLKVSGSVLLPGSPSGLTVSPDQAQLFVTCGAPESQVCVIVRTTWRIIKIVPVGHTAIAPVISPDGKTLYVCNRFDNEVSVIDLAAGKEVCRVGVQREPVAAALTKDGKFLLVANLLPAGQADVSYVAAVVSVIDTATRKVIKELKLPNGSASLNDIRVSPDGQYAVVTHIVGRFSRLTTHVTGGWMNANALTLIDLPTLTVHGTMLLDDSFQGAANPCGIAWSPDGATLVVTHAGTHEVSVIDFPKWLAHLPALPATYDPAKAAENEAKPSYEQPDDLSFFAASCRVRVKLPAGDLGPRAVVVVGHTAYVANYFSDTITAIDLNTTNPTAKSIVLADGHVFADSHQGIADGHHVVEDSHHVVEDSHHVVPGGQQVVADGRNMVRQGEFYFNDASLCYEGWQSCASCHPGGGRVDGLNWDLLNDGVGNPKNTKSLLLATKTSPLMSMGVRADVPTAVLAGIQHILFNSRPKREVVDSIVAYLGSLKPVPSPHLVHGKLSEAAERGKKVFSQASCIDCHDSELYTDQQPHDVGTRNPHDQPTDKFYSPTLIEVWRTAPYLHDGSAVTIREVVTIRNPKNQHGDVTGLSKQELDDLCEYVLSL